MVIFHSYVKITRGYDIIDPQITAILLREPRRRRWQMAIHLLQTLQEEQLQGGWEMKPMGVAYSYQCL